MARWALGSSRRRRVWRRYLIAPLRRYGLDHPVCFWDHETDDPLVPGYVVASDLWHFVRFLLRSELGERSWPFDREKVLAEDPAIAKVTGIDLRWQTGA